MSIGGDTRTESQYLSTSTSSLKQSKKQLSEVSKTYKHASQLYLTRRLAESYESLQPVIKTPQKPDNAGGDIQSDDELIPSAPIAAASTSQRIKIWSLYATLLNSVVELGDEEGKQEFGSKLYREIVRHVQTGAVWEQVVQDGYMGREGSVDAEVVYNLSNLLLGQAPNQSVNQTRLETYLSSSPSSSYHDLDLSAQLSHSLTKGKRSHINGTDTPKDLNSRIKILELFTLHVLPRNEEWDYAKSFISNSDILDEERREAFLQTLQELQDTKAQEDGEQDLDGFEDAEEDITEHKIHMNENQQEHDGNVDTNSHSNDTGASLSSSTQPHPNEKLQKRTGNSEIDYGIEDQVQKKDANGSISPPPSKQQPSNTKSTSPPPPATSSTPLPTHSQPQPQPTHTTAPQPRAPRASNNRRPPNQQSKPPNSSPSSPSLSNSLTRRAHKAYLILRNLTSTLTSSLSANPSAVFRTLAFIAALLMVLSRREVRERVKRVVDGGWRKVRATVGMGVKVSYI